MTYIRNLLSILLLLGIKGCSKEKQINPIDKCNFEYGDCFRTTAITSDIAYLYPEFLNNSLEIALVERKYVNGLQIPSLVKLDLVTNEKKVIFSPFSSVGKFDVNRDDLVVFSDFDWNVWTLRISTEQLNQISFSERDLTPRFNPKGDLICYAREFDPNGIDSLHGRMVICEPDGRDVSLFCRKIEFYCSPWDVADWGRDSEFIAVFRDDRNNINRISIFDTTGFEKEILHIEDQYEFINDVVQHPSKNIVYFTKNDGIYEINQNEMNVTRLTEICENTVYSPISISPDGKYLVGSRKEVIPITECSHIIEWDLILIETENTFNQQIFD